MNEYEEGHNISDIDLVEMQNVLDAERARVRELEAQNAVLREALEEIDGCFEAALIEGLLDKLGEADPVLYDIINRRLFVARQVSVKTLSITQSEAAEMMRKNDCWRPIDTAPIGEWVIGCESGKYVIMTIRNKTFWYYHDQAGEHVWSPTHWMPLPEQPIKAARAAGMEVDG